MRYFTRELFKGINSSVLLVRHWYLAVWNRRVGRYRKELRAILDTVPDDLAEVLDAPLDDARVKRVEEGDGEWVLHLDTSGSPGAPCSQAILRYYRAAVAKRPGVGDWWICEEIARLPDGRFRCEALLAKSEFSITFDGASIEWQNGKGEP
jgi:hypothetical protein